MFDSVAAHIIFVMLKYQQDPAVRTCILLIISYMKHPPMGIFEDLKGDYPIQVNLWDGEDKIAGPMKFGEGLKAFRSFHEAGINCFFEVIDP